MKLLITGAAGQLGHCLQRILSDENQIESVFTDIDSLDITNRHQVNDFLNAGNFSHLVNCAAYTGVDKAETDEVNAASINTEAVGNLAAGARLNRIKVIHISTDYVFPGENHRPYDERDEPEPKNIYGRTKLNGEGLMKSFCPDSIILRTSWLYSEFGSNFVKTILEKLRNGEQLNVVSDQIGTPTYAGDLAEVIVKILKNEQWMPGIYHYSNEGVASWYDFAKAIARLAKLDASLINPVRTADYPTAAKRPLFSVLGKNKIKTTFNLTIPYWIESLEKCLKN